MAYNPAAGYFDWVLWPDAMFTFDWIIIHSLFTSLISPEYCVLALSSTSVLAAIFGH